MPMKVKPNQYTGHFPRAVFSSVWQTPARIPRQVLIILQPINNQLDYSQLSFILMPPHCSAEFDTNSVFDFCGGDTAFLVILKSQQFQSAL